MKNYTIVIFIIILNLAMIVYKNIEQDTRIAKLEKDNKEIITAINNNSNNIDKNLQKICKEWLNGCKYIK